MNMMIKVLAILLGILFAFVEIVRMRWSYLESDLEKPYLKSIGKHLFRL